MKKLVSLAILAIMLLGAPYARPELMRKEAAFVELHKVSNEEQTIINEIFSNLDQKLLDLFDGKEAVINSQEYTKLFEQAGFTVFNLRLHKNYQFRKIDGYPKRVILKHEKLPGYFIKIGFDLESPQKNISRVMCTEIINSLINDPSLNITTIKKLHKKLCLRPGCSSNDLIDTNYLVLSPEQKGKTGEFIVSIEKKDGVNTRLLFFDTKKQFEDCSLLKEFLSLCDSNNKKMPFFSIDAEKNIFFTKDGKIAFIDTEIRHDYIIENFFEKVVSITP